MSRGEAVVPSDASLAAGLVQAGHTLIRAQDASLQAVAVLRKRDMKHVCDVALAELDLAPEYADEAFYSIPYEDRKTNETTYVEGLSIRSAERLATLWGNCALDACYLSEDAAGFEVAGIALDYENNVRISKPLKVSKYIKLRSGQVVLMNEKAQLQAGQSAISKAQRNAGLAMLPPWLKARYLAKAKLIAAGEEGKAPEQRKLAGTILGFRKLGVTVEQLESKLGKQKAEWLNADMSKLIGLGAAIRDGETSVEEQFSKGGKEQQPAAAGAANDRPAGDPPELTPDVVLSGATAGRDGAKPPTAQQPQGAQEPSGEGEPAENQPKASQAAASDAKGAPKAASVAAGRRGKAAETAEDGDLFR